MVTMADEPIEDVVHFQETMIPAFDHADQDLVVALVGSDLQLMVVDRPWKEMLGDQEIPMAPCDHCWVAEESSVSVPWTPDQIVQVVLVVS